ncbi:hypothetical protein MASR2M78_26850 [Treponema sp.]
MAELKPEIAEKIEAILAKVKEPETGLSISDLQLVKRISYSEERNAFLIIMDIAQPKISCMVCGLVTEHIRAGIERMLKEEFEASFPGALVETA